MTGGAVYLLHFSQASRLYRLHARMSAPSVNIARAIRGALLQAETKRWMVSRGKRKGQGDGAASSPMGGDGGGSPMAPSSPGVGGSRWHVGLEHPAATEAELAALLEVFEVREAEVKEHGHASTDIPSGEIAALLESIGISCSSGELEALYAQLQQVAGRIGEIYSMYMHTH